MYDWLLLIQTSADTRLGTWLTLMLTDLFSHYTYTWLCFPQQKDYEGLWLLHFCCLVT